MKVEAGFNTSMVLASRTGTVGPKRQKAELRAAMQDAVKRETDEIRRQLWIEQTAQHPDMSQQEVQAIVDRLQPAYDEYDPVIQLAVMAADHRNPPDLRRACAAEAAQYVRPKLKSVEFHRADEEGDGERRALAERLAKMLDLAAEGKQGQVIEGEAVPVSPQTDGQS